MRIVKSENCGNSPKNAFIEEFITRVISRETADVPAAADVPVEIMGKGTVSGLDEFVRHLAGYGEIQELAVSDAISHGKKGAVELRITLNNGKTIELAVFVFFSSSRADRIAAMKIFIV